MLKLDGQQYAAIARLSKTPDGISLIRVLEKELESVGSQLIDSPNEFVAVLQGKARALREVRDLLRDAPEIAEKLKAR